MKFKKVSSIAILTAFICINAPQAHAGFGDLAKAAAGGALGTVTADSLNSDINSGFDFFQKANAKYAEALGIVDAVALAQAQSKASSPEAQNQAIIVVNDQLGKAAQERVEKGEELSPAAKKLVKEGNEEFSKGIAKWVGIGAAAAIAANNAGNDAALAATIPVAMQLVSDLPKLKKTRETMKKLGELVAKKD